MQNITSQVWISKDQFDAVVTQFLIQREVELEHDVKDDKGGSTESDLAHIKSLMDRHSRDELWNWKAKS